MHIAINTLMVHRRLHGTATYVTNLVAALAQLDARHRYTLYVSDESAVHFQGLGPSFELVRCGLPRPLRVLWEQTFLPQDLRRRGVELFHGPGFVVPLAGACPRVTTIHDMTFFSLPEVHTFAKRRYFKALIPLCARASRLVITVSESTRQDLVRLVGVRPEKVKVIHLGKSEAFRPVADEATLSQIRKKYGLDRRFLLFVGMIEPRKNLETLVRAYAQLKDLHGDYSLVVAGPFGWKYGPLLRVVETLGLKNHVLFPGYVPEAELPALYSAAEVFVYPSLAEGFGLPVLEAMACGVPVITSNVSSLPGVVGEAALLVDARSVQQLATAMQRVLGEEMLRKDLRERGLRRAQLFTWEKTARETLEAYQQAAG
ncbi:MAG: glycosyltransferase family 4 protein [Candidatus Acidiferrales bacterium]